MSLESGLCLYNELGPFSDALETDSSSKQLSVPFSRKSDESVDL